VVFFCFFKNWLGKRPRSNTLFGVLSLLACFVACLLRWALSAVACPLVGLAVVVVFDC
jgi:hypothetical protein